MLPDDPRHGTNAGYVAGCRDTCCRTAHADYKRERRTRLYVTRKEALTISARGTQRRIRALQAIGWTLAEISEACGHSGAIWTSNLMHRDHVWNTTAEKVATAYEAMSMAVLEGRYRNRQRNWASARSWAPPLAWDDIDTDPEPWAGDDTDDVDHVLVARICAGDGALARHATPAERAAVIAAWTGGRNELERLTGWNITRENRSAA